jgi:hypothetical protein
MRENLAQLFRERHLLTLRQLQPSQLRNLLNFLFRNFHSVLPFPSLRMFKMVFQQGRRESGD